MVRLRNHAMTSSSPPMQESAPKQIRNEKKQRVGRRNPPKRPALSPEIRNIRGGGMKPPTTTTSNTAPQISHRNDLSSNGNGPTAPNYSHMVSSPNSSAQPKPARPPPPLLKRTPLVTDGPVFSHPRLKQYSSPAQNSNSSSNIRDTIHPPRSPGNASSLDRPMPTWGDFNTKKRRAPPPPVAFNQARIARLLAQKKRAPPPPTIMEVSSDSSSPLSSRAPSPGPKEAEPPVDYDQEDGAKPEAASASETTQHCHSPETGEECVRPPTKSDNEVRNIKNKPTEEPSLHETLMKEIKQAAEERARKNIEIKEPDKYRSLHDKLLQEIMSVFKERQDRRASGSLIMRGDSGRGSKIYRAKEKDTKEKINEGFTSTLATGRPSSVIDTEPVASGDDASSLEGSVPDDEMRIIELEPEDDPNADSWSPEQDLPEEETDSVERAITARSSNEPTFFHIFTEIGSDSDSPKKKMKVKRSSLKKIQHSMKTMLGSLGRTFAKKNKLREFLEGNWEIYHTQVYDDPPEGPISVHHIEKRPVYAYNQSKDKLMLIPDYERVIITEEGLVFRESAVTKVQRITKERLTTKEVKAKGVPVPVEEIRHRESRLEHERSVQDAIERQLLEVRDRKMKERNSYRLSGSYAGNDKPGRQMVSNFTPPLPMFSDRMDSSPPGSVTTTEMVMSSESDAPASPNPSFSDYVERDVIPGTTATLRPKKTKGKQSEKDLNSEYTGTLYLRERMRLQRHRKGNENPLYTSEAEDSSDDESFHEPRKSFGYEKQNKRKSDSSLNALPIPTAPSVYVMPMYMPMAYPGMVTPTPQQQMALQQNIQSQMIPQPLPQTHMFPQQQVPDIPPAYSPRSEDTANPYSQRLSDYLEEDKRQSLTEKMFRPSAESENVSNPEALTAERNSALKSEAVRAEDSRFNSPSPEVEIEDLGSESDEEMIFLSDTTSPSIPLNLDNPSPDLGETMDSPTDSLRQDMPRPLSTVSSLAPHDAEQLPRQEMETPGYPPPNEVIPLPETVTRTAPPAAPPAPPPTPPPPPPLPLVSQPPQVNIPNPPPLPPSNIPAPPPLPPMGFKPKSSVPASPTAPANTLRTTPPKSPSNFITPPSPHDNLMEELRKRLRGGAPQPFGAQVTKGFRPIKFNPTSPKSPEVPRKSIPDDDTISQSNSLMKEE